MRINSQSGNASVIAIILACVVVGGGAVYFMTNNGNEDTTTIPEEVGSTQTGAEQTAQQPAAAEPKSLPESYPVADAPIYQPGTIEMATEMGADNWFVSLLTDDDVTTVAESIASDFEALGAKVTQTPINEDGVGQVVASLGGYGTIMTYSTDTDKNKTSISYNVSKQQNFD
jgi:hypothetical protein